MSYITVPDPIQTPKKDPTLKMSRDDYRGATVDSRIQSVSTLATYVSGARWTVDYYSQILGRDDAASTHSDQSLHVHKQYRLIRGLVISISDDLKETQTSDGQRVFEMVGSGTIPYNITPTEGDVIVADVGQGQEMEFTVTSTQRPSIYPESYIDISYRAVRILTKEAKAQLDTRTIDTRYFSVDNQRAGLKALLTSDEAQAKEDLRRLYVTLVKRYIRDFYSTDFSTLVLPGHGNACYDPYLTRFVKSILDSDVFPEVRKINLMNLGGDEGESEATIWNLIGSVDLTELPLVASKSEIVSVSEYISRPLMNSIYYSGLRNVVRVTDPGYSVNQRFRKEMNSRQMVKAGTQTREVKDLIPIQELNRPAIPYTVTGHELPMINWVIESDYYVLSESFYEDQIPTSIVEELLIKRIENGTMDYQLLAKIAEYSMRFDNLERFYYTPIILALLKLSDGVI